MLSFLGLLFGVSPLARLALVAVVGALAFGGGFVTGYLKADQSATVKRLQDNVAFFKNELRQRADADEVARQQAEIDGQTESYNANEMGKVNALIDASPRVNGCVSGKFLDGLRRLK